MTEQGTRTREAPHPWPHIGSGWSDLGVPRVSGAPGGLSWLRTDEGVSGITAVGKAAAFYFGAWVGLRARFRCVIFGIPLDGKWRCLEQSYE